MNKNAVARANIFTDLMEELKRVTWPTRAETIRLTTVVIVISLIIGVYIGIIDLGLAKVLELLTKTR
jgi:preprotein translocase subunit SecE